MTMRTSIATVVLAASVMLVSCAPEQELPVLAVVESLELETHHGVSIDAADLGGLIHVVDFIFTSCEMACPMMTARLKEIHDDFADDPSVHFLSISTDPANDTVEVLARYAERWGADPKRWTFARAALDEVVRLSEKEFLLSAQGLPMGHSLKFALVDRHHRVRGYYDSEDAEQLSQLREDLARLAAAP